MPQSSPFDRTGSLLRDRLDKLRTTRSAPMAPEEVRAISEAAERRQRMLIPHQDTFASLWNAGLQMFFSRFDEALKDNWEDALAMRRDPFIYDLLRHRQFASVSLPWHIEVDDPKDPEQMAAANWYTKLIEAIIRFQTMRLYLKEDLFYGKYGAQVIYDYVRIDGRKGVTITGHEPVNGDKFQFKWNGTPGVLIHAGWAADNHASIDSRIEPTDRGLAIFLYDAFYRDRFIISQFEPSDFDWMFEGSFAGGVHGTGLRSRLYWGWKLRTMLLGWMVDALQRIGVNGMLYGYFEEGNPESEAAVIKALQMLIRDNVAAFPRGKGKDVPAIERIEPADVGYDVLFQLINDYFDEIMRRCVLGQSLSGETHSTGMGSKVAELHESTFEHYIRFDAVREGETFTKDLIGPLRKMNPVIYRGKVCKGEDIPFRMRMVMQIDEADVEKKAQAIKIAYDMGLELDKASTYEQLGIEPPKPGAAILKKQDAMPGMPPGAGAPSGQPGADGQPGKPSRFQLKPGANGKGLAVARKPGVKAKQVVVPAKPPVVNGAA